MVKNIQFSDSPFVYSQEVVKLEEIITRPSGEGNWVRIPRRKTLDHSESKVYRNWGVR